MKLLLDENLPKRLKLDFSGHEIFTVREMGWSGIINGELLKLMLGHGFDVLLTFDKNLRYQQNFSKFNITVFVLSTPLNSYEELTKLSVKINKTLSIKQLPVGVIVFKND